MRSIRIAILALCLALVAGASAGCAKEPRTLTPEELGKLGMSRDDKVARLGEGFPVQVPVHAGEITSARGTNAENLWTYEMDVAGTPDEVAAWYIWAFGAADWLVEDDSGAVTEGPRVITFTKGGAESGVSIEPGRHDTSLVRGAVGLGVTIRGRL